MDQQQTGKLIADRRRELGFTQKELAQQLHVSDRTVSKWERGAGFPDTCMLLPLAEALTLPVLDLLRGERTCPSEPLDPDAAVREALTCVQQAGRKGKRKWKPILQTVSCLAFIWLLLAFFGMIFLPVDRTQTAMVYRDGAPQQYTVVRWKGRLLYQLPWRLEFRGQVQTPLAQTTLDPKRDMQLFIPLTWDRTTSVVHKGWYGNVHSWEGPFVEDAFYLDWWGKEFAFCLSDGSIVATSPESYDIFMDWSEGDPQRLSTGER
ncbi:MAG: helix-turn-helix domain-containing protein [Eubacteriales bacterium]